MESLEGDDAPAIVSAVDEAGRQLRAPWAASVAGILFSILFTVGLVLLRDQPLLRASDAEILQIFDDGRDLPAVIGGLYLAPFAGIMFLWFVAVIRDQLGEREDRFFATVFFGSGILFVGLWFMAAAIASAPIVGVRYLHFAPPSAATITLVASMAYAVLFAFATRVAAVFLIATATIGLRGGVFPRWLGLGAYVLAVVLFLVVAVWEWIILVLPAWVAIASILILRRERARRVRPPGGRG